MLYKEEFINYLKSERNYSALTQRGYNEDLKLFDDYLRAEHLPNNPDSIESEDIRGWMACQLEEGHKPTTVNRRLSTLRAYYRFLLTTGRTANDPTRKLQGPKKNKPLPYFLKEKEMNRLLDIVLTGDTYDCITDRTIVVLFYETGMRLSELNQLNLADIDFVRDQIKVTGKRNKQRIIPFGQEVRKTLEKYISMRNSLSSVTAGCKALIIDKHGKRMAASQIRRRVELSLSTVTTMKKRSPHVLRHTFATTMLNHNANLEVVKELLGHESLATTEIYTHTTIEELKKIYTKAHPRS